MNLSEAFTEATRLSRLIDAGIEALRTQSVQLASAEQAYRKGKAEAWVRSKGADMLAKEKEAWVDSETADLRYSRDVADGMRSAALEAVRARRTQVSVLQSLLNAEKAEAEFVRTGP